MEEGPKKVLIVDDEEILTWIMSKTLSKDRKKYEVLVVNDARNALDVMDANPADLVITDIRMPGMSGLELLERIRQRHPQTKVIIMTAYGNPDVEREAVERGCLHYLEKPFKIEDLRNLILEALQVSKKGFVGRVADLQLTDIIQLNCLGKMKTTLSVSMDEQKGVICFEDGEIVHAELGSLVGEDALFTILGWEGGDFTTTSGTDPLERTIDRPWQELLIEGMRLKDEGRDARRGREEAVKLIDTAEVEEWQDLPEVDEEAEFNAPEIDLTTGQPQGETAPQRKESKAEPPKKPPAARVSQSVAEQIPKEVIEEPKSQTPRSIKEKAALIQRILKEWPKNTEEIQGAAVVTFEGLTLGTQVTEAGIKGEQLGALTASIHRIGTKSASALRRGTLQELFIRGAEGTVHLYVIGSKAILSVLARQDANMGMVHIESREQCKKIARILGA